MEEVKNEGGGEEAKEGAAKTSEDRLCEPAKDRKKCLLFFRRYSHKSSYFALFSLFPPDLSSHRFITFPFCFDQLYISRVATNFIFN